MQVSLEISFYPLSEEYKPEIKALIARFKTYADITCITNSMSTQLFGDYDSVMNILNSELKTAFSDERVAVASVKIINKNLATAPKLK